MRLPLLALLLLPSLALCQTAADKTSNSIGSATSSSQPRATNRPPRVIADLSGFHLDQAPNTKPQSQIGAGSRGGLSTGLILCAPNQGLSSTTHPLFEWKVPDAILGQVTFSLMNAAGDVLYEADAPGSSLMYPNDAPALVPGQTYSWKVSGGGMNRLPDPVTITIQDKPAHDLLMQKAQSGGAATDPLAHAQVFLQSGVWYDAVAALKAAIAAYPDRKDLTEQLTTMYQHTVPGCAAAN